jgi:hypothetical protein
MKPAKKRRARRRRKQAVRREIDEQLQVEQLDAEQQAWLVYMEDAAWHEENYRRLCAEDFEDALDA